MRLGIGSWTYGWSVGVRGYPLPHHPLTALELLGRAHDFGLEVVQIADNLPLHLLSKSELAELKARADAWNIEIEIGTTGIHPDHLSLYLELARSMGARLVRSLLSNIQNRPDLVQAADWIRGAMPAFEAAEICLALENYEHCTSEELANLIREIGSPSLAICLDTVNSLGALETPDKVVKELAPFVRSLHIKDFDIARVGSRMGFTIVGKPAGEGLLNVDWLLKELRSAGSEPNIILELWTPHTGDLEETILLEQEWAARSIRYLKQYVC
jgi:sugar phosphate isomerase/epimerase